MTQPAMPAHGPSASDAPLTMFGPDFPFAYDDWVTHPDGLGTVPEEALGTEVAVIGAGLAAIGLSGVNWSGVIQKVLIPAVAAPFIACLVAAAGTWLVYRITRNVAQKRREAGFRWGQIATASLVALSHGTNDAQKTMGVIALALITTGHLGGDVKNDGLPFWIIASCALAIGLGTYIGGWRVIRTLGKGLVEIESPQGLAAEASSAAIILSSSAAGMALSTTHVATGSILGSGVGKPGAEVRWAVAGRMAVAWLVTLPAAGIVGALAFWLSHGVESLTSSALAGDGLIFLVLVALSGYMWWRAQQQKVDHSNVNADWDHSTNSVVPADVREGVTSFLEKRPAKFTQTVSKDMPSYFPWWTEREYK